MKLADLNILAFGNTIQIAGAIYQGDGRTFLCFFPEDLKSAHDPTEVLEMDQADWEKLIRQTDIMEAEVLAKASDGKLAKIIIRKSTRHVDQTVTWNVFRRDGYRCQYCGKDDVPLTIDHLVTWEDGGPTTETNLLSACRKCNRTRGNLAYKAWLNHPFYKQVSRNLDAALRDRNEQLVGTLDAVPRRLHIPSR